MTMIPGQDPNQNPNPSWTPPGQQPIIVNVPPQHTNNDETTRGTLTEAEFDRLWQDRVEKARQEEKNKLYPQIQTLQEQLQELAKERDERLQAEQEAETQRKAEEETRRQSEMSALDRLAEYESKNEQRFSALIEERDRERALREKEAQYAEVLQYRARRIQEEADTIAPQLVDWIDGGSPEQIDQAIERAKQTTANILGEIQRTQQQQRQQIPLPVTGQPTTDAMAMSGAQDQREFTPDDIRNMSMEEYRAQRAQLQQAASQQVGERGLYGW